MKKERAVSVVLAIVASLLIIWKAGYLVWFGIFLWTWGNNINENLRKDKLK